MDAYVREYARPIEGLLQQLKELKGFVETVPPLIEKAREALWEELGAQPASDDSEELIDVYSRVSGEETGYGFARYDQTIYRASLVLAWEVSRDYLALRLAAMNRNPPGWRSRRTVLDSLETRYSRYTFPQLQVAYKKAGVDFERVDRWEDVEQLHLTRNAIVHNLGMYTRRYFDGSKPRFPVSEGLGSFTLPEHLSDQEKQDWVINREYIPLDSAYLLDSLAALGQFALGLGS